MLYFLITLSSCFFWGYLCLCCISFISSGPQKSHNIINLFSISFNKLSKKCFLFSENPDSSIMATVLISNCFSNFYMIVKNRKKSISYSFEWTQKLGISKTTFQLQFKRASSVLSRLNSYKIFNYNEMELGNHCKMERPLDPKL